MIFIIYDKVDHLPGTGTYRNGAVRYTGLAQKFHIIPNPGPKRTYRTLQDGSSKS